MKAAAAAFSFLTVFITVYHFKPFRDEFLRKLNSYRESMGVLMKKSLSTIREKEIIRLEIAAAVSGTALFILTGSLIILIAFIPVVFAAPRLYINYKKDAYVKSYYQGLSFFLETVVSCLKAGQSIVSALKTFADSENSPAGKEISAVLRKIELGKTLQEAFYELGERIPLRENEIIISAITTSLETGGNLTEILDNVLDTIRKREELNREIKTLTSQGVLSGIITGLLPFILAGIIFIMDPGFIAPLFNTNEGIALLCAALAMEAAGMIIIKKITDIK